ncbi:MAG: hypothetical protein US36_C0006G0005 [Candidatus Wolfebacteria bacterium GW2011_GWC1_37_10]|uniref:N-acetyltransferase domain-containing protein n=1 Tax=Candidatus Wolfebacteria bacterium GW2011_GWC1_37_10 TaxID=1619010 RepID=A0A0G0J416_9BACT|nr:MAG: hypothetical protein US36_C0006G0005 [Candidatus Wolfebacteria bacterium GW2011_GWC1_37_10]
MKINFKTELFIPSKLNSIQKKVILEDIYHLVKHSWGEFEKDFLEEHILKSERLIIGWHNNKLIGFCAMRKKNIFNKVIHYIEFTVVHEDFQKSELGTKLTYGVLRDLFFKNIFKIIFKPIEVMFITSNIRTISRAARFADFIYPNPYLADPETGKISIPDDETWVMAKTLVKEENPECILKREGLVLSGFYLNRPWFIYQNSKIPWHYNEIINKFADRYLGYNKKDGKEFVVRVQFGIISLLKYWFLSFKKYFIKV